MCFPRGPQAPDPAAEVPPDVPGVVVPVDRHGHGIRRTHSPQRFRHGPPHLTHLTHMYRGKTPSVTHSVHSVHSNAIIILDFIISLIFDK